MSSENLTTPAQPPLPPVNSSQAKPTIHDKKSKAADNKPVRAAGDKLFPQRLLNIGFCAALVLAGVCFISGALYLNNFLNSTDQGVQSLISDAGKLSPDSLYTAINARLVMARLALLSCGVFTGMSFGFLGFALFLIGIKEEMNVSGRYEGNYVKFTKMAPGVFVILCAAVLIGICVTRNTPFSYYYEVSKANSKANTNANANANTQQEQERKLPGPVDLTQPHN